MICHVCGTRHAPFPIDDWRRGHETEPPYVEVKDGANSRREEVYMRDDKYPCRDCQA